MNCPKTENEESLHGTGHAVLEKEQPEPVKGAIAIEV